MTFVITENCIKCKYTDCVDVCPVDCFHEGENMLVIDPDECIDCTLCEPECPANAIFSEDEVPPDQKCFIDINAVLANIWPSISEVKNPLETADQWNGVSGKVDFCSDEIFEATRYIRGKSLSESDLERGLHHSNPRIRIASFQHCDEAMFIAHIETCLNDPCPEVRSMASHKTNLNEEQITTLFNDSDAGVRASIAMQPSLTDQQLEQGLLNDDVIQSQKSVLTYGKDTNNLFAGACTQRP